MPRLFPIDTATASDDAVALIMAFGVAGVRVAAITTVAGNVDVQQATRNAPYVEVVGSFQNLQGSFGNNKFDAVTTATPPRIRPGSARFIW